MNDIVRVSAYAKLNLTLEVLGRRDDGFHNLASVVQTIACCDEIECADDEALSIVTEPPVIEPARNLMWTAAELLAEHLGRPSRARITLRKRIPIAAGLGGGSSDAAACLLALNALWRAHVPRSTLRRLAALLGADVPLFLHGGTVRIEGRGDVARPIRTSSKRWYLVVSPLLPVPDKTSRLYSALVPADYGDGRRTLALASALQEGRPWGDEHLTNSFDRAANTVFRGLGRIRANLQQALGRPVHLTGAGPSLFAIFDHPRQASDAASRISGMGLPHCVSRARSGPSRVVADSAAAEAGGSRTRRSRSLGPLLGMHSLTFVITHPRRRAVGSPSWVATVIPVSHPSSDVHLPRLCFDSDLVESLSPTTGPGEAHSPGLWRVCAPPSTQSSLPDCDQPARPTVTVNGRDVAAARRLLLDEEGLRVDIAGGALVAGLIRMVRGGQIPKATSAVVALEETRETPPSSIEGVAPFDQATRRLA